MGISSSTAAAVRPSPLGKAETNRLRSDSPKKDLYPSHKHPRRKFRRGIILFTILLLRWSIINVECGIATIVTMPQIGGKGEEYFFLSFVCFYTSYILSHHGMHRNFYFFDFCFSCDLFNSIGIYIRLFYTKYNSSEPFIGCYINAI